MYGGEDISVVIKEQRFAITSRLLREPLKGESTVVTALVVANLVCVS